MYGVSAMVNQVNEYPEEVLQSLAETFKLLGSVPRLSILCALTEGGKIVSDLAEAAGLSQSAVSHQLKDLRRMHIVKTKRDGNTIVYSLDDMHIISILTAGFEHIKHTGIEDA